ncbi:MAG: DUF1638 domain-containing protein [Firmicutes bacterium]|nr:DUF1638 domain-containing protein [Bacillota bacterium]
MSSLDTEEKRIAVIACAVVMEEISTLISGDMIRRTIDPEGHVSPRRLRTILQNNIDELSEMYADRGSHLDILLGFGLCAQALVGIRAAQNCTLVIPRVDDCIGIFLGSRKAHREQLFHEPGTCYLTGGWAKAEATPFHEFERAVRLWGEERARELFKTSMANYRRLALIDTGLHKVDDYRCYARKMAGLFQLKYEEISGSARLVKKMFAGEWGREFVVVKPGESSALEHFLGN